jgi:hypothetical protein
MAADRKVWPCASSATHPAPRCSKICVPIKSIIAMKTLPLIAFALLVAFACHSQTMVLQSPPPMPRMNMPPGMPPSQAERLAAMIDKQSVNYLIRVEWKEPKADPKSLEVLTTEGNFELDTIQKNSVKINNNDIPVTLKLNGMLTAINDKKATLQLFLGRTVPYVTGTTSFGSNTSSSWSQMSVGLQSTFVVTFGKPAVIQSDENGEISVLVRRMDD